MTQGKFFHGLTIPLVLLALAALFETPPLQAQAPLEITDLMLSNHLGNSFVLSWRTNRATTTNIVRYGKDRSNLSQVMGDSTTTKLTTVHFVQLYFLDINSTYFYRIESDGVLYSVSPSGVDSVRTFSQPFPPQGFSIQGQVIDQKTSNPIQRVLVRTFVKSIRPAGIDSTMWSTDLTRADGTFYFDYANYRKYTGQPLTYYKGFAWLHIEIIGPSQLQGSLPRDSVLLTADYSGYQLLPVYELFDERDKLLKGRIQATSPVLANGSSASVVWVTAMDSSGKPVPNVDIRLFASPDQGVTFLQPQYPTDADGRTWGLARSTVSGQVEIHARNMTSSDSTELDSVAIVNFVEPPGDSSQDKSPPYIYFTTDYGDTDNITGPYVIKANVVDNFTPRVRLVWTTSGTYSDTLSMANTSGTDEYKANIPGQAYNSVVKYFVMATDSAGYKVSSPDSLTGNPFILPYRFEIRSGGVEAARMGITRTTDLFDRTDTQMKVRVDTWITTTAGVHSAVIKYRNFTQSSTFLDIPMNHFGAHYWAELPKQQEGSRIEYFIQVVDSLGNVDKDNRLAPQADLFKYEVLPVGPRSEASYADTTSVIGTQDDRHSRHVAVGDLNGDTYPDVVVANYNEANSVYFYNRSTGALQDVTAQALGSQLSEKTTSVALADVDGDDDLDIIFGNEGQSRLYLNNGQGRFDDVTFRTFGGKVRMPQQLWGTQMVLADDFNGDGAIDLFLVNNAVGGEQNRLLFNDSLGVFTDASNFMLTPPADQSVWALSGDIDRDGDPDIIVINKAQNHSLWRNNGKGVFQRLEIAAGSAAQAQGGELVDVDGDGDLDLVVAQMNTQQNELFLNNGTGTSFSRDTGGRLPAESDNTWGIKAFDANLDGYVDLLYLNAGQANRLLLNNRSGTFVDAPSAMMPLGSSYSTSAAVADFNQDNRPDLYLTEQYKRNSLLMGRTRQIRPEDLPSAFGLLSPARLDTVNTTTVTFVWSRSRSTDSTDIVQYGFELSRDSLFTASQIAAKYDNLADTMFTVQGLSDNTRYFWRVRASNNSFVPVYSNSTNPFLVLTSYTGGAPVFVVILSRNPVLTGYMNIYIISSEPLSTSPQLTINLAPIGVSRVGNNDIWRAQYFARSGFLLSVSGVNLRGRVGEYIKTYTSILASAGSSQNASLPVWVEPAPGAESAARRLLVEYNRPPESEKLKRRVENLCALAGVDASNIVLDTESYTFTPVEGTAAGPWKVAFRRPSGADHDLSAAVCRLENGQWRALLTYYDPERGVYSAVSEALGTFALLSGKGPEVAALPRAFAMSQNVPNPFNPSTTIGYRVPDEAQGGRVIIRVYNLRGALIRSLVDRDHQPGVYAVEWDGRDDNGRETPSGVYFYRLKAEAAVISRKMVLIR